MNYNIRGRVYGRAIAAKALGFGNGGVDGQ